MSCGCSFRSASNAVMIFVVDATWRRWCACRPQSTRPVFASTRIAAAPASFGSNLCLKSVPPTSSRPGVARFAAATGCAYTSGARAGATEAIGGGVGRDQPPALLATTVQKCFRTPDIDEVGLDTYHLTFFEMMGNFSFGEYFKEGAIELATEFIRERLQFDWDRIWVSVHAGDPELKLGPDEIAIDLWKKIGIPAERITPLPSSENFWSVGGPGPCGPDSEIYYDWGESAGCGEADCKPGCIRCERFLEFWNLVFMEFELHADGTLTP